jgi:hypothetical protein
MKRFMRAEEDIKEVKQNFYRVMHCAFAKYEQGFKRKNEYLERRRVKRKEEIERGVASELKKRGMAGDLDDPLLTGINDDASTMNGHGQSGLMDDYGATGKHFEDSELSNGIVGTDITKKPRQKSSPAERPASKSQSGGKSSKKDKKKRKSKSKANSSCAESDEDDFGHESTLKITT